MKTKNKNNYSCQSWVSKVMLTFSTNLILLLLVVIVLSCTVEDKSGVVNKPHELEQKGDKVKAYNHLTINHYVIDIVDHPSFKGFGELLLPLDNNLA